MDDRATELSERGEEIARLQAQLADERKLADEAFDVIEAFEPKTIMFIHKKRLWLTSYQEARRDV